MALNGELQVLGGRLIEATTTAPDYKLYALDTTPPKPGMLRVDAGAGHSIKLELWALSAAAFGKFVAAIPPPLGIGTMRLADGRGVKGFVVGARCHQWRARYFIVRRLARVHGGEGVGRHSVAREARARNPCLHQVGLDFKSRTVSAGKWMPGSPRCGAPE